MLAVLIVAGVRVGVGLAIDSLEHPLGVLELHLFLLVALGGNLLLAFPLVRRHAIMTQLLLLLLTELFRELLNLLALLGAVAPRVVHQALRTTLVTAKGLPWPLVAP
jgi:hypothetical protein